jgi:lipid A disaccharide synthetase
LLQEAATPDALAATLMALLERPAEQLARFADLRARLGPPDALERCAEFVLAAAR